MTITSTHNAKLKAIRKLRMRRRERERQGLFVAEGEDLLAAADTAGWASEERFVAAGSGLDGTEVAPELLVSASGLASGTRALAVYREHWLPRPVGPLCVFLHGVADPGNVGTILRGAEAFGAACVALGAGCADPYSPKAVRASMGSVFAIPVARCEELSSLPGTSLALVPGAGIPLAEAVGAAEHGSVSVLVGGERDGLPPDLVAAADRIAHIPIASHSLNAAMAATIALYELTRRMPGA
jgi:TrmH family RNA methyltransferase